MSKKLLKEGFYAWHVSPYDIKKFDDVEQPKTIGSDYGKGTYYEIASPENNYNMYHRGRAYNTQYKVYINLNKNQLLDFSSGKSLNQMNKSINLDQLITLYNVDIFEFEARNVISGLYAWFNKKNIKDDDYTLYLQITGKYHNILKALELVYGKKATEKIKDLGLEKYINIAEKYYKNISPSRANEQYHIKNDEDYMTLSQLNEKLTQLLPSVILYAINNAPISNIMTKGFKADNKIKTVMSIFKVYGFIVIPDGYNETSNVKYLILWKNTGIVSILGKRKKLHQQFDDEAEAQEIADWMDRGDAGAF